MHCCKPKVRSTMLKPWPWKRVAKRTACERNPKMPNWRPPRQLRCSTVNLHLLLPNRNSNNPCTLNNHHHNNNNRTTPLLFHNDPTPATLIDGRLLVGNKHHAANVPALVDAGVVAVLNCASGGISRLPLDDLQAHGIAYRFTNVRQDDEHYPVLLHDHCRHPQQQHQEQPQASDHLKVAKAVYGSVVGRRGQRGDDGSGDDDAHNNSNHNSNTGTSGKVLFFCVAGQNRSAALAVAVLLLFGYDLEAILRQVAPQRPWILENQGFQRQIVQLEWRLLLQQQQRPQQQLPNKTPAQRVFSYGNLSRRDEEEEDDDDDDHPIESSESTVEIELLIPGLCTMDVPIPRQSTIAQVKQCLVEYANKHLLSHYDDNDPEDTNNNNNNNNKFITSVAKSWVVLAMFGFDDMYDVPLELEATDLSTIMNRIQGMFGLQVVNNNNNSKDGSVQMVRWTEKCRFALVIFSVYKLPAAVAASRQKSDNDGGSHAINTNQTTTMASSSSSFTQDDKRLKLQLQQPPQNDDKDLLQQYQQPWTFVHQERPGAPATFLENTLLSTHLRAWDFVTGRSFTSQQPIVFSFSPDGARDKRQFMKISTSAHRAQQFHAPGEGGILGMGANAIVHRVELHPTLAEGRDSIIDQPPPPQNDKNRTDAQQDECWDAAVKRLFDLSKMLKFLGDSSEAGLAKRMRFANSLNSDGRVVTFYGLGVGLAANAYNANEYKFEVSLLSKYEEEFSTYTMRRFIEDYVCPHEKIQEHQQTNTNDDNIIAKLQADFSLLSVKVLLVSLLNAFRDLTLMGIIAFDFNHLNNVLVSRDHSSVRLIDIDGDSRGSIQFPSEYIQGASSQRLPHKPSLDVDLNTVLPRLVQTLLLGKGRGPAFVTNTVSQVWRTQPDDKAKEILRTVLRENFFATGPTGRNGNTDKVEKHIGKVAEWFYSMLKKQSPWNNWTNDIYDAMRCIDHLPIT
mmetsp:Transcript_25492/g.59821  ORF Transcript_25492/g.59821 Transcript_25492/m.59821 type:complete len:958 (-) Transcript_25492:54-2927(-)